VKRLNVWELFKGVLVAAGGIGVAVALFAYLSGYETAQAARAGLWCVAGVLLVAGVGGVGYTLAQLSAGTELIGHTFGMTVGSFLGALEAERARARGQADSQLVASVEDTLPAAAPIGQALRDTGGPDGAVLVSRFKLDWVLTNMVIRQWAGKRISKGAMVADGVSDQRYWNLGNAVLIRQAIRAANSTAWKSRGSEALDLAAVTKEVKVVAKSRVWVLVGNHWEEIDLVACHFLNGNSGAAAGPEEGASLAPAAASGEGYHAVESLAPARGLGAGVLVPR